MKRTIVRRLTVTMFLLNFLAVTWPVLALFRFPEPFPFGLPLSMVWPIAWIVISGVSLLVLDLVERRYEDG
ncbi:MAG: hypothetical protein AAF098_00890 [Pseudomonadota bacterium]